MTGAGQVSSRASRHQESSPASGRKRCAALRQRVEAAQDPGLDTGLRAVGARAQRGRRGGSRSRRPRRHAARDLAHQEGISAHLSGGRRGCARGRHQGPRGQRILAMLPEPASGYCRRCRGLDRLRARSDARQQATGKALAGIGQHREDHAALGALVRPRAHPRTFRPRRMPQKMPSLVGEVARGGGPAWASGMRDPCRPRCARAPTARSPCVQPGSVRLPLVA